MDYRVNTTGGRKRGSERRDGNSRRRNRYYGKVILLCIMIGFCILALIEIIYGQEKLRLEQERLALEEQNARTLEALEKEQEDGRGTDAAQAEQAKAPEDASAAEITNLTAVDSKTANETPAPDGTDGTDTPAPDGTDGTDTPAQPETAENGEAAAAVQEDKHAMQIVFMGDSILDNTREDGVAYQIGKICDADVYNLSMGGTTAALMEGENSSYEQWDSRCLLGVVNAIVGNIDTAIFDDYKAGEIMKTCDFSKTDYFIIEYGVNDFLSQIPTSRYMENGEKRNERESHTYGGALDQAIGKLQKAFPDAKIILVAPHYCQFFNGETFVGDGYSLNYGYGALIDYVRACGYVYEQHREENVLMYNAFESSGIDAYTADDYLEDGIHLTAQGREVYADGLARRIMNDFYPQE